MLLENGSSLRQPGPAGLNIVSRTNSALDAIDLGLQRARQPIVTTKFGPQSAVLLHLVTQITPTVPVIWVDTGHNTKATYDFAAAIVESLNLNLHVYYPKVAWTAAIPGREDPKQAGFVDQVKLEPFNRALLEHDPDVWITALRREQTEMRDRMSLFQTSRQNMLKVCPLLDWRDVDIDAYLALHRLPGGHDFLDPTKAEPHLECGLHLRF